MLNKNDAKKSIRKIKFYLYLEIQLSFINNHSKTIQKKNSLNDFPRWSYEL